MPDFEDFTSSSSVVHGQRHRGWRAPPREVFWPMTVRNGGGSAAWRATDRAWWKSMSPHTPGTWTVTLEDGARRRLRLRLKDDGQVTFDKTPGMRYWQQYAVTLTADDPFWLGDPVTSPTWGRDDVQWFTGNDDVGAPPFHISPAQTVGDATLTNPGDVESWPVWEVHGPATFVSLAVGADVIEVPFTLAAGQTLVIDTGVPIALLDGVDVTSQLARHDFAPIPPGGAADLSLDLSGDGWVRASFTPRYFRSF